MRQIPKKLLNEILSDPEYKRCLVCGKLGIELNHSFTYSRRQINEKWAISPLCTDCHRGNMGVMKPGVREKSELWCLQRATPEDFAKYPRYDWELHKKRLE